ncbi:DUF1513 domain-containing protein [Rhodophyticola sp. CCM32]|uniref:DUF1513 domain-containing protein n=1 Tax=Rhodophyticola sp. CCM32 TaxID=2916397 RepID=UPI00107F1844|nr:DUF1513 domain-containing protein [Rhodophyticola sp. CCM32]QBY01486.1 DUF1513 domain-containing protein [Rhodophyticola sp. CCM32]
MPSRRAFLAGLLAAAATPRLSWADAGNPGYLSAARAPDGAYVLCGLDGEGQILFTLPLPGRGHAGAAHPTRPEAVAFARRPGTFADVINCATGAQSARLTAPADRHFYGHGAFSADGSRLYTTENDLETLDGRIGIWDAEDAYTRIGEMASGGVGPHELCRLPGTDILVIANGGIATHPDSGRAKLNLPVMEANLSYLDPESGEIAQITLPSDLRLNSIRHLAIRPDGLVAAAMQWEGEETFHPPLVLLHRRGEAAPRMLSAPEPDQRRLNGYAGSIAFSGDGAGLAITSPRGGVLHRFDSATGAFSGAVEAADICGLGPRSAGFLASAGTGEITAISGQAVTGKLTSDLQWDNHLVSLS